MIFQIKIELQGVQDPKVWRIVHVPFSYTFDQLHQVIQEAMGWRQSHLYLFCENGFADIFKVSSKYDEESGFDGRKFEITQTLFDLHSVGQFHKNPKPMTYIYDYGDHWEHKLYVEQIIRTDISKAELVDGEGACPPEDCGGIHGYEDIIESLRTGNPSKIHGESWLPWLEGAGYEDFDPEVFDLEAGKKRVRGV